MGQILISVKMCNVGMRATELRRFGRTIDRVFYNTGHRLSNYLIEHRILISVLLVGFIVWALVFNAAVIDYTQSGGWTSRSSWLGPFPDPDTVFVFGYAIDYQIEGYSDYSFYYVHWGYNFLYGTMPYSPEFGYLDMNGITNENGAHMFPPFTSYLYAFGIWLGNQFGWANWGIGLLLVGFGFLTALPIYGIARELSSNRRVGEVAALTYLLNPLVLYHTDFLWFNPAPFVFFFFSGFYMLIKGRKLTGTLLIVSAALFKQSAWFLGIPLIVYLLVKRRERPLEEEEVIPKDQESENGEEKPKPKPIIETLTDYFDLRGFAVSVIIVLAFMGAVMFPYLIAQPDFLNYWRLALGSFSFEGNFVDPPAYNVPMRVQALLIMAGMPEAAEFLDLVIISGGPMIFAVIIFLGVMMLKDRFIGEERLYLRRILFMTFMMMLLINIVGARGVFKYYFVAIVPFFSIFSSARMIRGTGEHVPFSISMALLPISFTLMILIPDRNFYLSYVILIFILYLLTPVIDKFYGKAKEPLSNFRNRLPLSFEALSLITIPTGSRVSALVNWMRRFASIITGLSLITFGFWIGTLAVGANLIVVLTVLLIVGIAFTLGPQMVSLALSLNNADDQNETLQNYSYITTATILIYGIGTYIRAWEVLLTSERQFLILSGIFVTIWASSLVIKLGLFERLIANMFLIGGVSFGLNIWFVLGDMTLQIIGVLCVCTLAIHTIAILSGIVHARNHGTIVTTEGTNEKQVELSIQDL
ncbi:MAG: hypothetical protein ACXAAQ_03895 [Candidatus Thorarchaeota archaeon]